MQRYSVKQSLLKQLAEKDKEIADLKIKLARSKQDTQLWVDRFYRGRYRE